MSNKPEPNWQPISNLPMIAGMIDGQITEVNNQYANLLKARENPYILDNYTIERVIKVFKEQQEFIWIYEKQLSRWGVEKLSISQKNEITRLQGQVEKWNIGLTDILALAEELKSGTIEKMVAKSDLKLGMKFTI
jgi:hypothetical protein